MNFETVTLYVNVTTTGKTYLIIGSDGKTYVKTATFGQFSEGDARDHEPLDFSIACPKTHSFSYTMALKTVPTDRSFWIFVLTPQVHTQEFITIEGHEDFDANGTPTRTFPDHLNVYLTHDGEYLGCIGKMAYHDELKSFIPTDPPKAILSLGFHSDGGHFEPQTLRSLNVNCRPYPAINYSLLKLMSLQVDGSTTFKGKLPRAALKNIERSLGIRLRFDTGTGPSNMFNRKYTRYA